HLIVEVVVNADEFFPHVGGEVRAAEVCGGAAGGGVVLRENARCQQELCIGIQKIRQRVGAGGGERRGRCQITSVDIRRQGGQICRYARGARGGKSGECPRC